VGDHDGSHIQLPRPGNLALLARILEALGGCLLGAFLKLLVVFGHAQPPPSNWPMAENAAANCASQTTP